MAMALTLLLLTSFVLGAVNGQGTLTVDPPGFFFMNKMFFPATQYFLGAFCITNTADSEANLVETRSLAASDPRPINFTIPTASYCFARLEGLEAGGNRSYWFGPGTNLGVNSPSFVPTWCTCQIVSWSMGSDPQRIQLDLHQAQFSNESLREMWPTYQVEHRRGSSGAWTMQTLNNWANTTKATIMGNAGPYEFRYRMLQADGTPSIYSLIESTPISAAAPTTPPSTTSSAGQLTPISVLLATLLLACLTLLS